MAEQDEEVMGSASPGLSDHKRKHEDLEPDAPEPPQLAAGLNGNSESESLKKAEGEEEDDSEAKRPRLEDKLDVTATENGYKEEKADKTEVDAQPSVESNTPLEDAPQPAEDAPNKVTDEELAADNHQYEGAQQPSGENFQLENAQEVHSEGELLGPPEELEDPSANVPQKGDVSSAEQQDTSDGKTVTRKMEVLNTKVGVLIGKAGDTIRYLQFNSGARIKITRDAEPHSGTRPVELIGTLENINKAEKLIKDVIAEADAGGSPSLVARGFSTVQAAGEQIQIQIPNEKVGLIIGKGGETIKNLQTRSGAHIQLIPQHLPEGDQSKERTVRVTGDKKQIDMAREMIKEVMDQLTVRLSPISSGYSQQAFRPRGTAAPQWGTQGPHPAHQTGYDYQQRGPYQSQNPQYAAQPYGNYPPQQLAPRSNFGWEQRPQTTMQGPPPHGGYDYYGRQGGHATDASNYAPGPSPAMGPPPSQASYNYGQPQSLDYGQSAPYSQTAPPPTQSYGHGYNETKYGNQVAIQNPYGGNGAMQQSAYPQGTTQPGYGPQEHYGKLPSYGMPPQGPHAQSYGQPRATQPGDIPYQGPISSTQSYDQPASAQQPYHYASSGQMQQNYPLYGSIPSADGYNHPAPATASAPSYPQQGGQPVSGYGQPSGQQAPGYAQYPASQPVYTEQAVPNNAAYVYQGTSDTTYNAGPGVAYGAPPSGQPAYALVAPTQQGYDQSIPQSGGYASVPTGYGKSLSPQPGYPQYDASKIYGAQR